MGSVMNERTRGYSHSQFSHHTSRALVAMIPLQHHCDLKNNICHLQLAVKQTAAKPEVQLKQFCQAGIYKKTVFNVGLGIVEKIIKGFTW